MAARRRADLHGAPAARGDAVRQLQRPQEGWPRRQADLHRTHRRGRPPGARRVRRLRPGAPLPGGGDDVTNAWERFIPFLAFPPELRKIICTTNAIESLNYQLRKIIKNRGHFPNDDAAIKLLWLAIRDIEDKRARPRAKEKGLPAHARRASGRLVEGAVVQGWKQALGALALAYPERLSPYLS